MPGGLQGRPPKVCRAPSLARVLQLHHKVLPSVLTVVLKALQFEEVLGEFALLAGGEVCYLKVVGETSGD